MHYLIVINEDVANVVVGSQVSASGLYAANLGNGVASDDMDTEDDAKFEKVVYNDEEFRGVNDKKGKVVESNDDISNKEDDENLDANIESEGDDEDFIDKDEKMVFRQLRRLDRHKKEKKIPAFPVFRPENDMSNLIFRLGMVFATVKEFNEASHAYGIKKGQHITFPKTDR